jgi:hypothetical protein
VVWGGLALAILYLGFYAAHPGFDGAPFDRCCLTPWMGWWDQSQYYNSSTMLAGGVYEARWHWYPLGYSILSVPFILLKSHRFLPVDLISLLATYAAFIAFARRIAIAPVLAMVLFLQTVCADPEQFENWAIPWNTSPSAALIWTLLALGAAHLQGTRRPFLFGIVAAALPLVRPSDAMIGGICLFWLVIADIRASRFRPRDLLWMAAGAALPLLPYAALYLRIYGPHPSPYMTVSGEIGFTLHNLVWRAYVLLIEPRQWFFDGHGLVERMPWLLLGFAGALAAWRRGGPVALLSLCLTAYCLFFLCYVDLLPTGLWRYHNVHYFKWALPGFGLLGWLLLRDLAARRRLAWGALAVVLLLSAIRVTPRLVGPDKPAVAVDLPDPAANEQVTTMNSDLAAVDARGTLANIRVMRAFSFPTGVGVRLIGLRRDFIGHVDWALGPPFAPDPQVRWGEHVSLGYPCWLPPLVCKIDPYRTLSAGG